MGSQCAAEDLFCKLQAIEVDIKLDRGGGRLQRSRRAQRHAEHPKIHRLWSICRSQGKGWIQKDCASNPDVARRPSADASSSYDCVLVHAEGAHEYSFVCSIM